MAFSFRNKYDVKSNEIAKRIFEMVKMRQYGSLVEENISVRIYNEETKDKTFENFHINADAINDTIHIDINLSDDFSGKDYQKFNLAIYEALRHELEHVDRYVNGKRPDDKYFQLYDAARQNVPLDKHIELVADYILSDTEIDSYFKSIMYIAKKQNKSALEVIEQVIKRAFFNNDSDLMKKVMENKSLISIIDNVRMVLRNKIKEYYPSFREKWL